MGENNSGQTEQKKFKLKSVPHCRVSLAHLCPIVGPENDCFGTEDNYTLDSMFKINPYLRGSFSQDHLKIKMTAHAQMQIAKQLRDAMCSDV